jgi:hypothetical protein
MAPSPEPSESSEPSEEPTVTAEPSEQPTSTDEPSNEPTESPEPSQAPSFFNSDRVESSAYILRYQLEEDSPPVLGSNLPDLLEVTDEYLLDTLRIAFIGRLRSVQTIFQDGIQFPDDDLVFIEYRTEIFGDFTQGQASRARLDSLIDRAFTGLPAEVYVEKLQDDLPRNNRFRRTIRVNTEDALPVLAAVVGSESGVPITIESP